MAQIYLILSGWRVAPTSVRCAPPPVVVPASAPAKRVSQHACARAGTSCTPRLATMLVFALTAAVVASDTARSVLEEAFAAGSVVVANHLWALIGATLLLGLTCCCWSMQRVAMGSQKRPIKHWSESITGRAAQHRPGMSHPVQGQWRLEVGKASVPANQKHLMSGTFVGRQVWRCVSETGGNNGRFEAAKNTNSNDKPLQAQYGVKLDEPRRTARQADSVGVDEALRSGILHYGKMQTPDGHWAGDYGGPMFLMPGLVITAYISDAPLTKHQKAAMVTYLRNHQQKDGGWGIHMESPSTMFGSVMNYVSIRLLGVPADDECAVNARAFIHKHGGAVTTPSWGKFWLSTLGVYDWNGINSIPPELWTLPNWFPFHPGRMWCHARMVYLPMSYIYGCRHTAPLTDLTRELRTEIFTTPYHTIDWPAQRNLVCPRDLYSPHPAVMRVLNRVLGFYEKCPIRWLRKRGVDFAFEYIEAEDRQTNYVDIGPVNKCLNMLSVFYARGNQSEEFRRHVPRLDDYLWLAEDGMRMQGYNGSQLWDTAFCGQALLESGLLRDEQVATTFRRLHHFVDETQVKEDVPERAKFYRHISKGGFPFSTADHGWPIADCTAEGLKVMLGGRKFAKEHQLVQPLPDNRFFDAVNVILSFQNTDGGWATYENTRGWNWFEQLNPAEVFGDIMIDYSYVELSSACVTGLAKFREQFPNHRRAEVDRAISRGATFIGNVQRADGSWYGSWAICFTYGTWFGVEGLTAAGVPTSSPRIKRAMQFVIGKQNEDGGWGESYLSCVTRKYSTNKQEGSQVVNTAWALLTLMAGHCEDRECVARGIRFLISRQLRSGDWAQESVMGVFNRTCGISYSNYRNIFPLWALGRYRTEYATAEELARNGQ